MLKSVQNPFKKGVKGVKRGIYNYCECCDYSASQKSHWDRHILTTKHKKKAFENVQNPFKKGVKTSKKRVKRYICEHCGEEYKNRSGLWYHKKNAFL